MFDNLIASDVSGYTVSVTESTLAASLQGNNTVDPDGGNDSTSNVVLGAGVDDLDQDFGYQAPLGSIGDTIFEDTNGNGVFDAGEGIAGVDVTLTGTDINGDPVSLSTTTDGVGNYLFDNLLASDASGYTVTVDETDLAVSLQGNNTVDPDGGNDSTSTVVLAAGVDNLDQDFGYQAPLGSIGNTIFEDANGNGVFDAGEGIAGVDVTLAGTDIDGNVINTTVITAGDGQYLFPNLLASDASGYTVTVDETDLAVSLQGNNTVDPDGGFDSTSNVVLGAGVDDLAQDFGYLAPLGSIGDFVWIDTNGDGIQDVGEVGINGTTVNLLDDSGNLIATTTTANNPLTGEPGFYEFAGLDAGDYEIEFTSPTGFIFSPTNQTTEDLDSDADFNTGRTGVFTLAAGEDNADIDVGILEPGSIGDHVWLDTDGDGVDDNGEQGISGVLVNLCSPSAADGTCDSADAEFVTSTMTNVNGDYLFDNLPPGDYQVSVDAANFSVGGDLEDLNASPGNTGSDAVTLSAGEDYSDADFGYVPTPGLAVIGDTVWADIDADGLQDPGEVGIAGVTLDLVDNSGTVIATTITGSDGGYLFTDVTPGDYTVVVTDTGGVLTDPATNVTSRPQSPGSLISNPITVLPNDVYVDADFGFTEPATLSLADRIWYDDNGDGVQDAGENGIAGVTVDLLDSGGNIIASVITDENGDFRFDGLPAGDYIMVITDDDDVLTGYFPTTVPADDLMLDVTVNEANDAADGTDDQIVSDVNFGFNEPGTIGDTIWNDANADGIQDPGEGGLNGVTLTLSGTDSSGNIVILTTTTDVNGEYLFTNVPPGLNYTIAVDVSNFSTGSALEGYTQTYDADDGTSASDNQSSLPLTSRESNLAQDFGYRNALLSDISGTVFYDVDTDGTYEPDGNDMTASTPDDETGLGGVTIDLIDSNSNVVATTITNPDGSYLFPDVPDGDYTVAVTDVSNVLDGYQLTSGLDKILVTADASQGDVTDVNFGYVDDELTAAIISGLWIDTDGDGIRDLDETPIPNVTINLIDCGADGVCGGAGAADDTVAGTAVTDADGNVIFPDLSPGIYALDADESDTEFPANITEITNYSTTFNNPNDSIALSEGETYDADFGYVSDSGTAGLSGTLWNDSNPDGSPGDGIQDASEVGLGGITVGLTNTITGAVTLVLTNPDGGYVFTGLTPCPDTNPCYSVTYDATAVSALGLDGDEPTNTPDMSGPGGVPDGVNDNIYLVNLQADEFKEDHDFGFDAPANQFGAVDGFVYYEPAPADSDFDPDGADNTLGTADDEPGIESVSVNLVDSGGNVLATTMTSDGFTDVDGDGIIDPAGYYSFTNLVPDDYTVVVTDVNNATIGFNPTENSTGVSPTLVVVAGATQSADFGYTGEQSLGNIGNLVWLDVVNDGIFNANDGDVGLAGITVECWADVDGDKSLTIAGVDNLVRTVTTDANGEYYCEGLPSGGYLVRVTDDEGVLIGSVSAALPAGGSTGPDTIPGTQDDLDNANKMAIPLATIVISGPSDAWYIETASDNLTADFAVTGSNSLSGLVFEEDAFLVEPDDDGTSESNELDATFDAGEDTLVAGVTVILMRQQPDGTFVELLQTTTLADGSYNFASLPDGNYQVVVDTNGSSIDGYGQTADPDLTALFPGNTDADREARVCDSLTTSLCDDTAGGVTPIALTGGTAVTDVNFGYQSGFVTTPITLGYFYAQSLGGDSVEINWQTVTEVAHLGFNLYVREEGQGWRRLNDDLIPPAADGDSFDIREYSFMAYGVKGKRFALGDVDVTGKETIHGPFSLGVCRIMICVRRKWEFEANF